jgi:hypothetical protein
MIRDVTDRERRPAGRAAVAAFRVEYAITPHYRAGVEKSGAPPFLDGVDVAFRSPQQFFRDEHVPHSDLLIDFPEKSWAGALAQLGALVCFSPIPFRFCSPGPAFYLRSGLALSQLLTLYTTPVVYLHLDRLQSWLGR